MTKYHLSEKTGKPNRCTATKKPCPIQGEHFDNRDDAQAAYEKKMKKDSVPAATRKYVYNPEKVAKLREEHDQAVRRQDDGRGKAIDSVRRRLEKALPPLPSTEEIMAKIETPDGFTRTVGVYDAGWGNEDKELPELTFEGDGITIKIDFHEDEKSYAIADGHVSFTTEKGTRTFDRTGVSDSFYIDNPRKSWKDGDGTEEINETISNFIKEKVPAARARIAGSEPVPGTGFLVTPEKKAELVKNGRVTFTPAGFGQGMEFTTIHPSVTANRWAKPATKEQKEFFGVDNLWVSTFDHD